MGIESPGADPGRGIAREGPFVAAEAGLRILLYSHDTAAHGQDSIWRTMLLADALTREFPSAAIVIMTGSPLIYGSRLPVGVDFIKLPELRGVGVTRHRREFVESCSIRVRDTRRDLLGTAVESFCPDLLIVDDHPAGLDGELNDALETLARDRPAARIVLGIPDIKGDPGRTRDSLLASGSYDVIDRLYEEVWIYGTREVFDTVREYGFPESVARKSHYCGYLTRRSVPSHQTGGAPRVLLTATDDNCGTGLAKLYLDGFESLGRLALRTTVGFGAGVSTPVRDDLMRRYGHLDGIEFHDLHAHPERHFAQADVVISTACYPNVCEILSFGQRAVLAPCISCEEDHSIRAERLSALRLFEVVEAEALRPDTLVVKMLEALESGRRKRGSVDLGGIPHIMERVRAMLALGPH